MFNPKKTKDLFLYMKESENFDFKPSVFTDTLILVTTSRLEKTPLRYSEERNPLGERTTPFSITH